MASDAVWNDKCRRKMDAHVAPLNAIVQEMQRTTGKEIPWFDPDDAGVDARILLLLESPGPVTSNSRFISRENADPTARHVEAVLNDVGINRSVAAWNAIPWWVGDASIDSTVCEDAAPWTIRVIDAMGCKPVVLLGNTAVKAWRHVEPHLGTRKVPIHLGPHPGQQSMNQRGQRDRLEQVFRRVAQLYYAD